MLLMPQFSKRRKCRKGNFRSKTKRGCFVSFGDYGIQATGRGWLTAQSIESARIAINRELKKTGKICIKVFPDKPITKKPAEVRMGKGKGGFAGWVAVVEPGRIIFEIGGDVAIDLAKNALRKAASKLPFKTRFVESLEFTSVGK